MFDPVSLGVAAGVNLLAPVVAKGIGGLFGLDEPSEEERRAAARRQEAIDRLTAEAEGRTASPAQLAALAQQQRTQQALQSLAQRGSVQQRAGNVRAAMQAAPEIMAQQGAVAAQTRAEEMARARNALAQAQMGVATQEAAQGAARREYMQKLIGAGIQGAAGAATMAFTPGAGEDTDKISEADAAAYNAANTKGRASAVDFGAAFQRGTDAARQAGGVTSEQAAKELGFTAPSPLALGAIRSAGGAVGGALGRATLSLGQQLANIGRTQLGKQQAPVGDQAIAGLRAERYGDTGFVGTAMSGMRKRAARVPGGGGYAM